MEELAAPKRVVWNAPLFQLLGDRNYANRLGSAKIQACGIDASSLRDAALHISSSALDWCRQRR